MSAYAEWFRGVTGFAPLGWQEELGAEVACADRLIRIPTGFGKTAGVVLAWLYQRVERGDDAWPRRLVFCLPMRVLVEQTERVLLEWMAKSGLDASVHTLLGGREIVRWVDRVDRPAILVGTQDMLLSRALHRGYASARGLWPMELGAMHHDALWVTDEVQLMDTGLATSAQLAAFREAERARGATPLRPAYTWWMSATLQRSWLRTVDFKALSEALPVTAIDAAERRGGLWDVDKSLARRADVTTPDEVAALALEAHVTGEKTLVVVNTVQRAVDVQAALAKALKKATPEIELRLVHSRFRGAERAGWTFLRRDAEPSAPGGRILVATQVVEAGVDLSASVLVTDLAPWSSLVQRFGRCARYPGEHGAVTVVGAVPAKDVDARPYDLASLAAAAHALDELASASRGVSPRDLEAYEAELATGDGARLTALYPYEPMHVLRRPDFDDLFDTSADLSGADLDVGRFIRSGEERDVTVFWRPLEKPGKRLDGVAWPSRVELCPVPVGELKKLVEKRDIAAYTFDYLDGAWTKADVRRIAPGMTVLLPGDAGGYDTDAGWDAKSKGEVPPVPCAEEHDALLEASLAADDDGVSIADGYKTIAVHGRETAREVERLCETLRVPTELTRLLSLAARWHDAGKAHVTFQRAISEAARAENPHFGPRRDLAKAPRGAFEKPPYPGRPGFRHELASTLMLFETLRRARPDHPALLGPHLELLELTGETPEPVEASASLAGHPLALELAALSAEEVDLVAYLVCAHHGKVRARWASTPQDIDAEHGGIHGVVEGDVVPEVVLAAQGDAAALPATQMSLSAAALGVGARYGASWTDRVGRLVRAHGPFRVAFLELLLRVADWRASALPPEVPS